MRWMALVCVLVGVTGVSLAEDAVPQATASGYSGIAPLARKDGVSEYLVVHDRKDMPAHTGRAWLGTLTVGAGRPQPRWQPLRITPPAGERPPNDLEACCTVPGRPNHFLLAESGYYHVPGEPQPRYGRIIHVSLKRREDASASWTVTWHGSFRPLPPPRTRQPKARQIEGLACVALAGGRLALVFTHLGDVGVPGRIFWGALDLEGKRPFALRGQAALARDAGPLGARSSAAIHVEPCAGGRAWQVWSVASVDPGDAGPFRSRVFLAGALRHVEGAALLRWCRRTRPAPSWSLDGFKVEGLTSAPASLAGARWLVVTDDEDYGGVLRPLHASP